MTAGKSSNKNEKQRPLESDAPIFFQETLLTDQKKGSWKYFVAECVANFSFGFKRWYWDKISYDLRELPIKKNAA